jgi:hypothetical protein
MRWQHEWRTRREEVRRWRQTPAAQALLDAVHTRYEEGTRAHARQVRQVDVETALRPNRGGGGSMNELPEILTDREKFDEWVLGHLNSSVIAYEYRRQLLLEARGTGIIASSAAHEFASKIAADPVAAAEWINAAERRARA